jgi:serine O-acetyltransferase
MPDAALPGSTRPKAPPLPKGDRDMNPKDIGLFALIAEDYRTHDNLLLAQGFWVLFWHRFGNWRMSVRPRLLRLPLTLIYRAMFKACEWFCGCKLSYNVPVGRRVRIDHFGGMVLGARSIGSDVILRQNTTLGIASPADLNAKPRILDRCDIGAGAVIVGDITIGPDAVVGANAVVLTNVPPHHMAVGVPARIRPRRGAAAPEAGGDVAGSEGAGGEGASGHPQGPATADAAE